MSSGTFTCPSCGSENTQRVPLAYEAGTQSSETTGVGATWSRRGGVGLLGGVASSASTTALAKRLAPPPAFEETFLGVLGAILVVVGLYFVWPESLLSASKFELTSFLLKGVVLLVVVMGAFGSLDQWTYGEDRARWSRSVVCLRCGHIWEHGSP